MKSISTKSHKSYQDKTICSEFKCTSLSICFSNNLEFIDILSTIHIQQFVTILKKILGEIVLLIWNFIKHVDTPLYLH
jgi:hypothetical protein